jgi:flagellar motor protein MotB
MSDEQIYDSDPNEDTSWLVTYGDMVTLLMAFFVLMFSAGKVSEEKYEQVAQSIAQGFNSPGPELIAEVASIAELGQRRGSGPNIASGHRQGSAGPINRGTRPRWRNEHILYANGAEN